MNSLGMKNPFTSQESTYLKRKSNKRLKDRTNVEIETWYALTYSRSPAWQPVQRSMCSKCVPYDEETQTLAIFKTVLGPCDMRRGSHFCYVLRPTFFPRERDSIFNIHYSIFNNQCSIIHYSSMIASCSMHRAP